MLHIVTHASETYRDPLGLEQLRSCGHKVTVLGPEEQCPTVAKGETLVAVVWTRQPIESLTTRADSSDCARYRLSIPSWCSGIPRNRVVFVHSPGNEGKDKPIVKKLQKDARRAFVAIQTWRFA